MEQHKSEQPQGEAQRLNFLTTVMSLRVP